MKKVIVILIILSLIFISFFVFKKEEEKINKNISVILETEEGNIETNTFPSKEDYEYLSTECENTNDFINTVFNENTWKLNLSVEEKSVDGKFNCTVHFKEKSKIASDVIVRKYSENNTDGLIKLNQPETEQTPALVEYRYSGSNEEVKNYVEFNNETWRIIGVFSVDDGSGIYESRLKIIRNDSIGNMYYNVNGTNNYLYSTVNEYLNNNYYNSIETSFKNMIANSKYYLGAITNYEVKEEEMYEYERKIENDNCNCTESSSSTIICGPDVGCYYFDPPFMEPSPKYYIGKVRLMYPSDYGYAAGEECTETLLRYNYSICKNNNWIYSGEVEWFISPYPERNIGAFGVSASGSVSSGSVTNDFNAVRPVLYLKSSAKIISGEGTLKNMYKLK